MTSMHYMHEYWLIPYLLKLFVPPNDDLDMKEPSFHEAALPV